MHPSGSEATGAQEACTFPLPFAERSCLGTAPALACVGEELQLPTTSPPGQGAGYATGVVVLHTGTCSLRGISSSYTLNCTPGSLLTGPGSLLAVQHISSPTFRCRSCTPELCSRAGCTPKAARCISVRWQTAGLALPLPAAPTAAQRDGGGNNAGQRGGRRASSTAAAASSSLGRAQIAPGPRGKRYKPHGAAFRAGGAKERGTMVSGYFRPSSTQLRIFPEEFNSWHFYE